MKSTQDKRNIPTPEIKFKEHVAEVKKASKELEKENQIYVFEVLSSACLVDKIIKTFGKSQFELHVNIDKSSILYNFCDMQLKIGTFLRAPSDSADPKLTRDPCFDS